MEAVSVVIPYMAIEPYKSQLPICLETLYRQTMPVEIIISQCELQQWFPINKVLNDGFERASYEHIFTCNADFELPPELIQRIYDLFPQYEVVFGMYRGASRKLKTGDGGYMVTKTALKKYGKFDESLLGISRATFVFMDWALDNLKWFASPNYQFILQRAKKSIPINQKRHKPTYDRCRPYVKRVIHKLERKNLWLV